jgi:hypothetical protein
VKGAARVWVCLRLGSALSGSVRRRTAQSRVGAHSGEQLAGVHWLTRRARSTHARRLFKGAARVCGAPALRRGSSGSARLCAAWGEAGTHSGEWLACVHWLWRRARFCAGSRDACTGRGRAGRGWRGARCALGRLCGAVRRGCHHWLLNCPILAGALCVGFWWSARLAKGAARACTVPRLGAAVSGSARIGWTWGGQAHALGERLGCACLTPVARMLLW